MTTVAAPQPIGRLAWRLAAYQGGRFAVGAALWVTWWTGPALAGLVLQAVFDAISGNASARPDVPTLLALLALLEIGRLGVLATAVSVWSRWWVSVETLLRTNLLQAQLANGGPGAGAPVGGAGKALAVFRDDAEDLLTYVDTWLDLAGTLVFGLVAVTVMARVDARITLVVVLPLLCVFVVTRVLADRIRRVRRADREATSRVTGFLGDVFAAVLAVKVAGAEPAVVGRLAALNRRRRGTALRDRMLTETLEAFNGSTVDVTIGLVLLLSASAMRAGTFTVGDLALFAAYSTSLAALPRWAGLLLTRHRHAQVAAGRMAALLPRADPAEAVVHRRLSLEGPPGDGQRPRWPSPPPAEVRLRGFGVPRRGARGVAGVDLHLPAGSFTVVCGPVGSGKTTLLRGLLGLAGPVEGTVEIDGAVVSDLAAAMIPPRCAYVPQVPRLLGATLRDNLALGLQTSPEILAEAVDRAALRQDVEHMPEGMETLLGPRGVRLSGGQLQRVATARALTADAALLVLDDLSSALDAATERRLWSRLLSDRHPTVLVVSARAAALERAEQVIVLADGGVRAVGPPARLRSMGLLPGTLPAERTPG